MTLNFVPDGKSKGMSKIEGKLKAEEVAKGKGASKEAEAAKKDKK